MKLWHRQAFMLMEHIGYKDEQLLTIERKL